MRGQHHLHVRKRKSLALEPYPAHTRLLRVLDRVVLTAGVIGPLMTIPQILKIYLVHDAAGVSLATWGLYALFDTPWIVYGIVHRETPITVSYILWCLMNATVFFGALFYGAGSF